LAELTPSEIAKSKSASVHRQSPLGKVTIDTKNGDIRQMGLRGENTRGVCTQGTVITALNERVRAHNQMGGHQEP